MDPIDLIKLAPVATIIPAIVGYAQYKLRKTEIEISDIECRLKIHEILLERIKKGELERLEEFTNSTEFRKIANCDIQTKVNQFLCDFHLTPEEIKAQSREGQLQARVRWNRGLLNGLKTDLLKEINNDIEKLKRLKNLQ